ncbi:hypothetical protein JCM10212_004003 [Sporobolomyces blumeae]
MHIVSTAILAGSLLVSQALASVYIVKPDGSDYFNAGKRITITWLDSEASPPASAMGPSTLYLATGSSTAHTNLATLATVDDPSKTLEVPITIDASWAPDTNQVFILLESNSAKDDSTGQPLQAFSARFRLSKMKGTFPAAALAQLEPTSSGSTNDGAVASSTSSFHQVGNALAPASTAPSRLDGTSAVVAAGATTATTQSVNPTSTLVPVTSSACLPTRRGGHVATVAAVGVAILAFVL